MKPYLLILVLSLPACAALDRSGGPSVPDSVAHVCRHPDVLRANLGDGRYYDCKTRVIRRWKDLVRTPV
jgi:hypothetical protein